MKLFAFHLLNDYSGSPKVLSQLIKGWVAERMDVTVVTCSGRQGFLSDIEGARYMYYPYRWRANPLWRLINLFASQFALITKMWRQVQPGDIVYINTVLPFGAAILGKLKTCRVVYHVHETSMKPKLLKRFLFGLIKWAADDVIYVSKYLSQKEPVHGPRLHTLHNALDASFYKTAYEHMKQNPQRKNVLMICSLKAYKGVFEFLDLASLNPNMCFRLVVNASQGDIDAFFKMHKIPANMRIYPTQTNTHPFYSWADVVLNLSRPDGWIETFGLTMLEAMAYELPVLGPDVGGITELIEPGVNGFTCDSRNIVGLSEKLNRILGNETTYTNMRQASRIKCASFSERAFIAGNLNILFGKTETGIYSQNWKRNNHTSPVATECE